ncbi:MAG: hypothetical protein H6823_13255 [Planctomycetaceae bacterium]|nr:hypothetical protein [Planctomycetaceae bacterium]
MQFDESDAILVSCRSQIVITPRNFLWLTTLVVASLASLSRSSYAEPNERKFDLSTRDTSGAIRDVQVAIEVTGDLKLNADGKQVNRLPMRVSGTARYDERTLRPGSGNASKRDARFYRDAKATIAIGDGRLEMGLNSNRRLIVAEADSSKVTLFSPLGPLTRDELELIQTQGNSSVLDRLAPAAPVALNTEWAHDPKDLAILLGLDAIHQTDIKSTLRQVENNVAIIDMAGKASGAIDGVASDIALRAKYNINLQSHRVTWLAMSVREDRAIGHATPGFDVTARVRVEVNEKATSLELTDSLLSELPLELNSGSTLLRLASTLGGFALLHARDWQMMVDRHDVTILRMIEQGELIAQCNISSLPDLTAGKRVQLPEFQADIEKALGKNFGQFVEASQQKNESGHRVLRAVVSGLASELPIQWIYYHISDDTGRQTALVFAMDVKVVEKFAAADESIVGTFEFVKRVAPTPAPAATGETASKPASGNAATAR